MRISRRLISGSGVFCYWENITIVRLDVFVSNRFLNLPAGRQVSNYEFNREFIEKGSGFNLNFWKIAYLCIIDIFTFIFIIFSLDLFIVIIIRKLLIVIRFINFGLESDVISDSFFKIIKKVIIFFYLTYKL